MNARSRDPAFCARACACAGVLALFSGCATTPDAHYFLSADGPAPVESTTRGVIGFGPVSIPDYINRPEMGFQSEENRFELPQNHRWTGSLERNITDVLATNLARRFAPTGMGVRVYPWTGSSPSVRVAVDIQRFHAVSAGDAVLEAAWHVTGLTKSTRSVTLHEPLVQDGYAGMVAAQSRLLSRLADAIAASLTSG